VAAARSQRPHLQRAVQAIFQDSQTNDVIIRRRRSYKR
jgi:hypothetical protein